MTILAKWLGTAAAAGALALTPLIADAAGPGGGHAAVSGGHSRGHWGGGHGFGSGSRFDRPHWSGSHWYGGHWGYRGGWYARPSVGFDCPHTVLRGIMKRPRYSRKRRNCGFPVASAISQ